MIWGVVLLLIGVGFSSYGYYLLIDGKATEDWSAATGQVTQCEVETKTTYRRKRTQHEYLLHLSYQYVVDGQTYTSSRYSHSGGYRSSSERACRDEAAKYPVGSSVEVFFNPANPSDAILVRGVTDGDYALFVVGLVLIVVGLPLCAYAAVKGLIL
jgi:hypothetical protein